MIGHEREEISTGQAPWKSPIALSVGLHALIIGVALAGWSWTTPKDDPPPRSISARLITQQEPVPSEIVEPVEQVDREQERKLEEQKRQAEQKRREEDARIKAEAEKQRKAEAERKKQEAERRKREEEAAKAKEAARLKAEAEAKERERLKAEEEKRKQEAARKKAEEEKRRQEEQRRREEEARKEAERKRQEAERRLREQQLEALADQARKAEEAEARRQAEAAAARAKEAQMLTEAEKYRALIYERVRRNWYKPPSATEDLKTTLRITLLPTGELVGVSLVESSGNAAFDNTALSAARAVGKYPVPSDRQTFEKYFRQFALEFTPRGLQ